MSLHIQSSPKAKAALASQKRNSTILAIIISLLALALIVAILFYIALSPLFKNTEEMVTYSSGGESEEPITKPEMTNEVEKKPTSPASSLAKVIAANTPSAATIPVPDVKVLEPSLDFGDGNDFGDGWGSGAGSGSAGGGGTSFFGQKAAGERILYIIDYSRSMRGMREKLMRAELAKSVMDLQRNMQFQLIFFAGPAWVAGDKANRTTVKAKGGKEYQWTSESDYDFACKGDLQQPKWLDATAPLIKESVEIIEIQSLVPGTDWSHPLEMAFSMDPLPQVIIFMTDGMSGGKSRPTTEKFSKLAKEKGVLINTIVLIEPKAAADMEALAIPTGGTFAMINKDGKKVNPPKMQNKK
jgi:hypothetical protein